MEIRSLINRLDEINSTTQLDEKEKVKASGVATKSLGVAAIAYEMWDAWQQIEALDPTLSNEERTVEVRRIVSKQVAQFGLFTVGAILGALIAGAATGGVGTLVGLIAGGIGGAIAQYTLGDDLDVIVDAVVNYLHKKHPASSKQVNAPTEPPEQSAPTEPPASQAKKNSPLYDKDVEELQIMLRDGGSKNPDGSPLTADGIMGTNTVKAVQTELVSLGAKNSMGGPLSVSGELDDDTLLAIRKYYIDAK